MSFHEMEINQRGRRGDTYAVSTPYGVVKITNQGRRVTFELFDDIRQSQHNAALFAYLEQLRKKGIVKYNVDHLDLPGLDRGLDLRRGNVRLDLVYEFRGKTYECELKTHREVGLDRTWRQTQEFVKHCQNFILLVPRGGLEEASTIRHLSNLDGAVKIEPYDTSEDEE